MKSALYEENLPAFFTGRSCESTGFHRNPQDLHRDCNSNARKKG